jgi:predicted RND superfamily exporter protein
MLIAVANDYGIHIIAKYQELNTDGNQFTNKELIRASIKDLWKPITITGFTTVAGLLGLLSHQVIPSRQMGIVTSFGILFALAASLLLLPSLMSLFPKEKPLYKQNDEKLHLMDRLLNWLGKFVTTRPKQIIIGTVILTLGLGSGLAVIGLDANPISFFKEDNEIKVADNILNDNFGGTQQFVIMFEGDIKDPELLKRMDSYVQELEPMEGVGDITCLSEVIKEMSQALNDEGDAFYNKIPDTREAVAQYLEMYMMSGDPEDFDKMVDFDYEHAQMIIRVNDASTPVLEEIKAKVEGFQESDPSIALMGGFSLIVMELGHVMLNGQLVSILLALVIVFVIMVILFKSLRAGVLGTAPLIVSVFILFGVMGILGMTINMASAMLSSILIGVGIDYTIHFMWRYRDELRKTPNDHIAAIRTTLNTTGRGIAFNAISVMVGFVVLMTSNFIPIIQFGYLIVFSVFTCLVGALILVPAICLLWKPKFLEN